MSIYLYIKTHQITGLKYFGKTVQDDPYTYKGSGMYWKSHLKKHGNHVDTEVLGFYEKNEVESVALKFSRDNNIVNSKEWANLIEENGLDGGSDKGRPRRPPSAETRAKMSAAKKGQVPPNKGKPPSAETRAKMSAAKKGQVPPNKGKPHSAETRAKMSAAKKGRPGHLHSDETRAKISAANRGQKHSAEARAKMSAAQKGKTFSAETRAKMSASHKKRLNKK